MIFIPTLSWHVIKVKWTILFDFLNSWFLFLVSMDAKMRIDHKSVQTFWKVVYKAHFLRFSKNKYITMKREKSAMKACQLFISEYLWLQWSHITHVHWKKEPRTKKYILVEKKWGVLLKPCRPHDCGTRSLMDLVGLTFKNSHENFHLPLITIWVLH